MAKTQTLRATVPPRAPCKPAGGTATVLGGPEVAKRKGGAEGKKNTTADAMVFRKNISGGVLLSHGRPPQYPRR